ncbi:A/G-specific adenine glycosylase [Blattabacterium cuenoti]|uniref:A/G-specific adenine glycosylase n=1 Tax=Blattabacterium cuenoti TaxID=1653831 RepID=UPI00163C590D|nr:A/G-specific adenine glycosylase [Blattabacterium cuenoti]
MNFHNKVINWYKIHKRILPWRKTKNPYHVLVSEFMLQQTRISKVLEYYDNFIKKFPNLKILSKSDEITVLKEWEGLGFYFRAINLHNFSKKIFNIRFPRTYKELIKYKGIGLYTASAISSICFNEKIPAIDGNAYRLYSRYFGIYKNINYSRSKKFLNFIYHLMDKVNPGIFNQSIMDISSIICTPVNSKCFSCPIKIGCYSLINKTTNKLPIKISIINRKNKFLYYLFIETIKKNFFIKKRLNNQMWGGMYDFPIIESNNSIENNILLNKIKVQYQNIHIISINDYIKYNISNKIFYIKFINCLITNYINKLKTIFILISYKMIKKYPFPKPILSFFNYKKII